MLPTYPLIETIREERNSATIRAMARQMSPMLDAIQHHIQFEGRGHVIERYDESVSDTDMANVSAELNIPTDLSLDDFTADRLHEFLAAVAGQMAEGTSRHFFREIDAATEAVGNVVDGKGRGLSEELVLEIYGKLEHSFDADGVWQAPQMFMGGDRSRWDAIHADADFQKRLKELLRQKRDDFRRREAGRVLAG